MGCPALHLEHLRIHHGHLLRVLHHAGIHECVHHRGVLGLRLRKGLALVLRLSLQLGLRFLILLAVITFVVVTLHSLGLSLWGLWLLVSELLGYIIVVTLVAVPIVVGLLIGTFAQP